MPELPEVEIMARNLSQWALGRTLTGVDVVDDAVDSGGLAGWATGARGQRVSRVWRRGKYAVADFTPSGQSLVLHFRMTGKVVAASPDLRRAVRLVLSFESRSGLPDTVVFDDSRRLGNAWLRPTATLAAWFDDERRLGPEPWPEPRNAHFWQQRLGSSGSPIKVALMDQPRVAGLGNIAASEILWRARVSPTLRARSLTPEQWDRLAAAVPAFIEDTLERESGAEIAYVNSRGGSTSGVPSPFSVYRNHGRPCRACHTPIERFKQSGRSTFWCPSCQGDCA